MGRGRFGCPSSPLRLPHSLPFLSFPLQGSAPPSELFSHLHPGDSSCGCGGRSAEERGYRACLCFSGVLQPSVCYSHGHWRVASGDRYLTPQQLRRCLPFPYGDSTLGAPVPSSGGLDGFVGPSGCIPASSSASVVLKVSEVLRGGFSLPVPLCFGLATAPQVFTWVMAPVSSIMHRGPVV